MKLAICNETYGDWPLAKICDHVAGCGYDGLEIAPFTLADDPSRLTLREAATVGDVVLSAGLEVVGLHWLLVRPEGLHICTSDAAVRRRTIQFAIHLAELCGAMGGRVMVWGSPRQRTVDAGQNAADAWAFARDAFRQAAEAAARAGVTIALEPLSPAETNFLTTAADTIRMIDAVEHPNCRLHLDVKAMSSEAASIPDIIRSARGRLVHFHANDSKGRAPYSGVVDFAPIMTALAEIEYRGYVSVEVFDYTPSAETIAAESAKYLRGFE